MKGDRFLPLCLLRAFDFFTAVGFFRNNTRRRVFLGFFPETECNGKCVAPWRKKKEPVSYFSRGDSALLDRLFSLGMESLDAFGKAFDVFFKTFSEEKKKSIKISRKEILIRSTYARERTATANV